MADEPQEVTMRNPEIGSKPRRVRREAFDLVWRERGFELVEPATVAAIKAGEVLGKEVEKLDDLTKEELASVAASVGAPVDGTKKGDFVSAINSAFEPQTEGEVA
jgi:hypothetical protein